MLGYEVWTHHNESARQTTSVVKEDDRTSDDRMEEDDRTSLKQTLRILLHRRFKSFLTSL
jgi:hypothetical protein